jgi:signal recognition particle receptor subunit beta
LNFTAEKVPLIVVINKVDLFPEYSNVSMSVDSINTIPDKRGLRLPKLNHTLTEIQDTWKSLFPHAGKRIV